MKKITYVTALLNIKRDQLESPSFNRPFKRYLDTLSHLLRHMGNNNMVIYIEDEHAEFVRNIKPNNIIIKSLSTEEIRKSEYFEKIQKIRTTDEWRNQVGWLKESTQANLELYNPLIFQKIHWLDEVSNDNPFNSEYFMWIDAGLSRFFGEHGVSTLNPYPSDSAVDTLKENKDSVLIQTSMSYYPDLVNADVCSEDYFWDARTWIMAGLWGGGAEVLTKFCDMMDEVLQEKMLKNGVINNEQNAMAYLYKNNDDMFVVFENYAHMHRQYEIIAELSK